MEGCAVLARVSLLVVTAVFLLGVGYMISMGC